MTASGGARDGSPEVEADKNDAYDTLSTVLATLCRVAAPLLPLLTESVYQGLTDERSVHLADWPGPDELPPDPSCGRDGARARGLLGWPRHTQGKRQARSGCRFEAHFRQDPGLTSSPTTST